MGASGEDDKTFGGIENEALFEEIEASAQNEGVGARRDLGKGFDFVTGGQGFGRQRVANDGRLEDLIQLGQAKSSLSGLPASRLPPRSARAPSWWVTRRPPGLGRR